MKVSIIISVYKDTEALELILKNLSKQTYKEFEIIVSEDGNSQEMKSFLLNHPNVKHVYQEDIGWRKNKALNNAIKHTSGEYLIFIDGDVIPYSNFIENHIKLSETNKVLIGRRFELGQVVSKLLRNKVFNAYYLEMFLLPLIPLMVLDRARHIEDGIKLKINGFLEKKRNSKRNKMILGCNFSCFKKDLEIINGFDEKYINPTVGEDEDLMWRFEYFNIKMKPIIHLANVFHLWHHKRWDDNTIEENHKILKLAQKNKEYFCKNGLIQP